MNAADINQPGGYAGEVEALQWKVARVGLPGATGRAATEASGSASVGTLPGWLPHLNNTALVPFSPLAHLCFYVCFS